MADRFTKTELDQLKRLLSGSVAEGLSKASETGLRDYFAAMAMSGILARPDGISKPKVVSKWAYEMADQMLLRRGADDSKADS